MPSTRFGPGVAIAIGKDEGVGGLIGPLIGAVARVDSQRRVGPEPQRKSCRDATGDPDCVDTVVTASQNSASTLTPLAMVSANRPGRQRPSTPEIFAASEVDTLARSCRVGAAMNVSR